MEYVDNGTLLSLLEIKLKLNETDARYYFRQLIDAVKYCHGKHIAHRDLKLENLLLTKSNCVKVADFGFARKFKKNSDNPELSSTYCGSNSYACPEILKELPYDPMMAGTTTNEISRQKDYFNNFQQPFYRYLGHWSHFIRDGDWIFTL